MVKKTEIEFKKVKFTPNQIIMKKRKQNVVIPLEKIEKLFYAKFSIKNYLILGFGDYRATSFLYIYLKEKINRKKMYSIFIKYGDLTKIPENIYNRIKFFDPSEPW